MSVPAATEAPLDPNAVFVVEVVGKVVGQTWPEYPGGLGEYLAGIGCTPGEPRPADLSKGDTAQAAKILTGAIRRADAADPEVPAAREFLAELEERLL